jgi:hypothetical protein
VSRQFMQRDSPQFSVKGAKQRVCSRPTSAFGRLH